MSRLTTNQFLQELKSQQPAASEIRSAEVVVPEKVFIEREGNYPEYTIDEPDFKQKLNDLLYGEYAHQNFIELFYSLPEIFAPVHEIASRVADANWQLCSTRNDAVDYNNADFNRLFSQPNPLFSHRDLIYCAVCYEILTGKQLWYFNRTDVFADMDVAKSIISWWNLPSHRVLAILKETVDPYTATSMSDFVNKWKGTVNGKPRMYETKDVVPVLHLDLNHPTNVNKTKSMLEGASKAIKNLIPVYEARGVIYIKRGAMGFVVSRKKSFESGSVALTNKEKKAVDKEVNGRFGLTGGRATIAVVPEDVDFVKTSMSISEMEPFAETVADAAAIYAVLRVPSHLIPSKDKSTFNNANTDLKSFYTDVVTPWAKRYGIIFQNYMQFKNRWINADYSHLLIFQDNKREQAAVQKTTGELAVMLYEKGVINKNQRNVLAGFEAVADGESYATDPENSDPLAVRLGVGGTESLQKIISDPTLDRESKKQCLIILFGLASDDADKMVPKTNANVTDNTGKQETGPQGQK